MASLTEIEIFDRMRTSLRDAEQAARDLAVLPAKGENYEKLRQNLRLVEGCCRQVNYWRQDTRWLPLGRTMAEVHRRAGDWLRGVKDPEGRLRRLAPGEIHPLFNMLADNLRAALTAIEELRTKATGRRGVILPTVLPGPHRDSRPVQVRTPGGVYLS